MSSSRPAQIFATLASTPRKSEADVLPAPEEVLEDFRFKSKKIGPTAGNEIQVTASAELTLAPDRCRVTIFVHSKKENAQDAKNSVARRSDYIIQTLYNHQVKESDVTTSKVMSRQDGLYVLDTEVTAVFSDFQRCQTVTNLLVEKLDENVRISVPEFFQSPQRLENLRRQASLTAVSNARSKATEIARFLHANIGRPIAIREEGVNEWEGGTEAVCDTVTPSTMQQRIAQATVHINVKCSATFELKAKGKHKEAKKDCL